MLYYCVANHFYALVSTVSMNHTHCVCAMDHESTINYYYIILHPLFT